MNKRAIKRFLTTQPVSSKMLCWTRKRIPRVFVYHRFSSPEGTMRSRVRSDEFGWQLDRMLEVGEVMTLGACVERFYREGRWPGQAIVVTVDDAYDDFHDHAYPELEKRGLQATLFPVVDFVDRRIWLWPDKLDYALRQHSQAVLELEFRGEMLELVFCNKRERARVWRTLVDICISMSDDDRNLVITEILAQLDVVLASVPPGEYSSCTWDQLRAMKAAGIEIGCHSKSHPILSKVPPQCLDEEIVEAKRVLEMQLGQDVTTFCYPNSGPGDINDTVVDVVRKAGFAGAVFGVNQDRWDPYMIPRLGASNDRVDFLWKLYGHEKK